MRRVGTGLVLTAVLGVGVAAAVDALPGAQKKQPASRPARPDASLVNALRSAGARGVLTYADAGCRLHAIRLPTLRPARAPEIESCEPHIPSGGIGAWKGDVVWSGYQTVQVVLPKKELTRRLARLGRVVPGGYRSRQAVWLGEDRYAVVCDSPEEPWERILVFLRGQRIARVASGFLGSSEVVRPSPRGGYVASFTPGDAGIRLFSRSGRSARLPAVSIPHAIAWSPDEQWTALATRWSLYLFRTTSPDGPVIRLPLAVRDLDWGT